MSLRAQSWAIIFWSSHHQPTVKLANLVWWSAYFSRSSFYYLFLQENQNSVLTFRNVGRVAQKKMKKSQPSFCDGIVSPSSVSKGPHNDQDQEPLSGSLFKGTPPVRAPIGLFFPRLPEVGTTYFLIDSGPNNLMCPAYRLIGSNTRMWENLLAGKVKKKSSIAEDVYLDDAISSPVHVQSNKRKVQKIKDLLSCLWLTVIPYVSCLSDPVFR